MQKSAPTEGTAEDSRDPDGRKGPSFAADLLQLSSALSSSESVQPMRRENTLILLAMVSRKAMEEELLPTGGEILHHFSLSPGRTVGRLRKRAAMENLEKGFSDRSAVFEFLERELRVME